MIELALQYVCVCLVIQLGDDEYALRQGSQKALELLLPYSMPAVKAGCNAQDLEIQRRCESILHLYVARSLPVVLPWLDMQPSWFPFRQAIIDNWLVEAKHGDSDWT